MKTMQFIALCGPWGLILTLLMASCAPPEEPDSMQKFNDRSDDSSQDNRRVFNFGGAQLGDEATKAAVKTCVAKGFYYERGSTSQSAECTTYPLAKMDCTEEGIKAAMSPGVRMAYESNLKSDEPTYGLAGFVPDQCIDCPTADSNPVCSKAPGNPGRKPGFVILHLKQSGSQLMPREQFVVK